MLLNGTSPLLPLETFAPSLRGGGVLIGRLNSDCCTCKMQHNLLIGMTSPPNYCIAVLLDKCNYPAPLWVPTTFLPILPLLPPNLRSYEQRFQKLVTIVLTSLAEPPFSLLLLNSSPRIDGTSISVDFQPSKPVSFARCSLLPSGIQVDCKLDVLLYHILLLLGAPCC